MISYDILKIKLLSIIKSIKDYTSDPIILTPCNSLKENFERDSMKIEILEYCCGQIEEWYENNLSKICNNKWVTRPESHKKNVQTIKEINADIQADREKYEEYLSKDFNKKEDLIMSNEKIFIVHGHDNGLKNEVARFVGDLGLTPIILHEQPSGGNTIIEKIEQYSNVGFGIVLYTPCDKGGVADEEAELKYRARQNVVFEHGYLIGKLGRKKVCALIKKDVEKPNDISGVIYISYDENGAWKLEIAKELKAAGYNIDLNNLLNI